MGFSIELLFSVESLEISLLLTRKNRAYPHVCEGESWNRVWTVL